MIHSVYLERLQIFELLKPSAKNYILDEVIIDFWQGLLQIFRSSPTWHLTSACLESLPPAEGEVPEFYQSGKRYKICNTNLNVCMAICKNQEAKGTKPVEKGIHTHTKFLDFLLMRLAFGLK